MSGAPNAGSNSARTGPKSAGGRARAARNALRHGFNVAIRGDGAFASDVEALARKLAGRQATPALVDLARRIAEAQIDVARVRRQRHAVLRRATGGARARAEAAAAGPAQAVTSAWALLAARIEKLALARPGRRGDEEAANVAAAVGALAGLDRYERRALSRRKFAIRAFDAARTA